MKVVLYSLPFSIGRFALLWICHRHSRFQSTVDCYITFKGERKLLIFNWYIALQLCCNITFKEESHLQIVLLERSSDFIIKGERKLLISYWYIASQLQCIITFNGLTTRRRNSPPTDFQSVDCFIAILQYYIQRGLPTLSSQRQIAILQYYVQREQSNPEFQTAFFINTLYHSNPASPGPTS